MAVFYNAKGKLEIKHEKKKTFQGDSKMTKFCQRGRRPRRKPSRGQGK